VEDTDVIVLWGSNAREAHPIFFHHVLRALRRGAKLYVVDPRRTSSAEWADGHLALHVGTDIELASAVAREILARGLENRAFIEHATVGFEAFRAAVEPVTLARAERVTGVPSELVARLAHDLARADRAVICWTLGITEHHDAVDNVLSLINLALLTGHVGRWGSGLSPLRGQNNVQGGGDMGALPHKLAGFQDVEDGPTRARFEAAWGAPIPPKNGWNLTEMFAAMARRELRALLVVGENPAHSEADRSHAEALLSGLEALVVQDVVLTRTAELAHVVLPAAASWAESEGTVTNSERRVQRVRRALPPPGPTSHHAGAADDLWILSELARRAGRPVGPSEPEALWDEVRKVSPMHAGMSYARLEAAGGLQWPCPDETHPGTPFLHARLWERPLVGPRAPFSVVHQVGPAEPLSAEYPVRLTTGRRLDAYNTGVQTAGLRSPLRAHETVDLAPSEAARWGLADGERVRVRSRRGAVVVPVRVVATMPAGLAFMTFHDPDRVDTNLLTIDATDPKSGTAEFKAAAVCLERVTEARLTLSLVAEAEEGA
jgi:predicted molibdopterin-dependent oxidoreductase YjgC